MWHRKKTNRGDRPTKKTSHVTKWVQGHPFQLLLRAWGDLDALISNPTYMINEKAILYELFSDVCPNVEQKRQAKTKTHNTIRKSARKRRKKPPLKNTHTTEKWCRFVHIYKKTNKQETHTHNNTQIKTIKLKKHK